MSETRDALSWALAVHFSQNRQPCMSGDPRDRLSAMQRRNLDDAVQGVLNVIAAAVAAEREACAAVCDDHASLWKTSNSAAHLSARLLGGAIRARGTSGADALAEVRRQARREALEEAVRQAEMYGQGRKGLAASIQIAAAIRALMEADDAAG